MATVVNLAFPSAVESADGNIEFKQSIAEIEIHTMRTDGDITSVGTFPTSDHNDADTPDHT
jgi:hypothetical protein